MFAVAQIPLISTRNIVHRTEITMNLKLSKIDDEWVKKRNKIIPDKQNMLKMIHGKIKMFTQIIEV